MTKRLYIIKSLSPWMMDELIAFSQHTTFSLLLLRNPPKRYAENIEFLHSQGIEIIYKPTLPHLSFCKIAFIFSFISQHFMQLVQGYSSIIGWKAIWWFLQLNLKSLNGKQQLYAQFATQAALLCYMLKQYQQDEISYSFTFHAHDIYFDNKWFSKLVNKAQYAFSISNYNIDYVINNFKDLNTSKLMLSRLGAASQTDFTISKSDSKYFTLGFMGRFVHKKGVPYLIQAMKELSATQPDVQLLIAGDGPLADEYNKQISAAGLTNIKLLGNIAGEAKRQFFASLDAFIMPSVSMKNDMDGLPVVLMEASAFSLPLIATQVSGITEICRDGINGYLVPEKNATALKNAIEKLITNPQQYKQFRVNAASVFSDYNISTNSAEKLRIMKWL